MTNGIDNPKRKMWKKNRPANYSHRFSGVVSAKNALSQSLNIPAVRLLNMYGYQAFYDFWMGSCRMGG